MSNQGYIDRDINFLAFIAQVIGIWIDIEDGDITELDCILAMGDNTPSMG